ncbi:hypothetical protein PMIN06_012751 [Paraphaeosphaeria minitans]
MRQALVSVTEALPYTSDGFRAASRRATITFQISQDAGIPLRPNDGENLVQAVQVQPSRMFEENNVKGASALCDQVTSWMNSSI